MCIVIKKMKNNKLVSLILLHETRINYSHLKETKLCGMWEKSLRKEISGNAKNIVMLRHSKQPATEEATHISKAIYLKSVPSNVDTEDVRKVEMDRPASERRRQIDHYEIHKCWGMQSSRTGQFAGIVRVCCVHPSLRDYQYLLLQTMGRITNQCLKWSKSGMNIFKDWNVAEWDCLILWPNVEMIINGSRIAATGGNLR